jgi:hypothetical protein
VEDRSQLDPAYFSIPESDWREVGAEVYAALERVHLAIGLALAELAKLNPEVAPEDAAAIPRGAVTAPAPAELALQMHEAAGGLLSVAARDEADLRQIIGTLRTGLAVCWDLYSVRESERVTVAEHMRNLRTRIEDFERELLALRREKGAEPSGPTDD